MASLKIFLVLVALLYATVLALPTNHPGVEYDIHSIEVLSDVAGDAEADGDGIVITDVDDMIDLTTLRAPEEKAVFAVEKVETGYARTSRVGITVQKGTSGKIQFRIRLKAVTVEQLALKARFFKKALSRTQRKELKKLSKDYSGGYDIPWLKYLGIDLSKDSSKVDFEKARSKILGYARLAGVAKKLMKETVVQKIEVRGVLHAHGVSFIPTTVFSFVRIARVYFEDSSKMLVMSKHAGDGNVIAGDSSGRKFPSSDEELDFKIL